MAKSRYDFNIGGAFFALIWILITFIASVALWVQNVPQGFIFAGITITSVVVMFFYLFFINENKIKIIELPFFKNLLQAETGFWLAAAVVIIFNIPSLLGLTKFNTYSIIKPFYIFATGVEGVTGTTFSVIKLQLSPGLSSFFTTAVASGLESIAFNVVAVWIGILLGVIFLLWIGVKVKNLEKHRFVLSVVGFISSGFFVYIAHKLNKTYEGYMFIIAIIFFILMNIIIYYGDDIGIKLIAGFMFLVGFHFTNNALADGIIKTLENLFFTQAGFLLIGWLLLGSVIHLLYNIIFKWKEYKKELKE